MRRKDLLDGLSEIQREHLKEVRRLRGTLDDAQPSSLYLKALEGAHKAFLSALNAGAFDDVGETEDVLKGMSVSEQLAFVEELKQQILGAAMEVVPKGDA